MTSVDVVVSSPESVEIEWSALVERVDGSPFLEPGWILAWHRAFGRGRLMVVGVRRDRRLVAVLPVLARTGGLQSPANWHTPEYGIAAEDDGAAMLLLRAILPKARRSITLRFVDHPTAAVVRATAESMGFHVHSRVLERSPYVPISGSFEEYEHSMSSKFRSDLARRRRRLNDEGPVRLDVVTDATAETLVEFIRLEGSGWKSGNAIEHDVRARGFYAEIARWADGLGLLRIAFLRVGDRAVAADFSIETDRRHYLLKTGYDPDYRRFGPGKLLRHAMLERAFAANLVSYEFLGTDDPWKLEWTDVARDRLAVQAFAPSLPGRVERAAYARGRPLAKAIVRRAQALLPGKQRGSRSHAPI
ncbi:MAG TPA: GNAT family N-acetyltransferase [Jiangellaceae bacterium]